MSPAAEPDENGIEWEPLESSHIEAMAEIQDEARLLIRFKNGNVYSVAADHEECDGLRNATSPGRYVNLMFKGKMARLE